MKILITGGAGFIGSHIADALIAEGHNVKIIDNLSSGLLHFVPQKAEFMNTDIQTVAACQSFFEDVDVIFHEAAIASVPKSVANPYKTQRSGEVGTLAMLQMAVKYKIKRFIFAASSAAYGMTDPPLIETMMPNPMSPYAASKLSCENYIKAFCNCYDIEGISLRYFNVFGPRQDSKSPYSGVISHFLEKMRKGIVPVINGDGLTTRDFTYVENVVQANLLAMKAKGPFKGEVFNVGCGQEVSLNQLVNELNTALGTNLTPNYREARLGDPKRSCADISAAKAILGYSPTVSFSEGIRRLVEAN